MGMFSYFQGIAGLLATILQFDEKISVTIHCSFVRGVIISTQVVTSVLDVRTEIQQVSKHLPDFYRLQPRRFAIDAAA